MANIGLKDILISARQEAYRMRHFYLGVEHLFIALLEIKGGLASGIMETRGLAPEYVIDALRRKIGKGSRHRLWAGIPNTPRTEVVLGIANELALEEERKEISERDLLIAILEESDNMPVRVLRAFNQDTTVLEQMARTRPLNNQSQHPFVKVDFGPNFDRGSTLSEDHLFVLRRMFHGYDQVRVERRLTGGYTRAMILVVTPITVDNAAHAPVVVKIDQTDVILDEAQRYDTHIKNTLPPFTARLEDRPIAPETSDYAGIKYTFVATPERGSQDLHVVGSGLGGAKLGDWLRKELFPTFGATWWQQRRPYRFQVWREYDWLLPPILTLEYHEAEKDITESTPVLKMPLRRSRLQQLEYGDLVVVDNFTVHRVNRDKGAIQLATGHGVESASAYKIEIRGIDLHKDAYYRGEVVERIAGRIYKTRAEQLRHAISALEPDFDAAADTIPALDDLRLPNPLLLYEDLLDRHINGSLSKIHGDLHLGNILIGPHDAPALVDFAQARDGHTLFDWATLEMSLLCDLVMTDGRTTWNDARAILRDLHGLNGGDAPGERAPALAAVAAVRDIVRQLLAVDGAWSEYYVALALCALRATTWDTMHIGGKRLMYLVAALSMYHFRPGSPTDTPSPDETSETEVGDNTTR